MIQIKDLSTAVQIGQSVYPKNSLGYIIDTNKESISIYTVGCWKIQVDMIKFDSFVNDTNIPYTSLDDLITTLNNTLFI